VVAVRTAAAVTMAVTMTVTVARRKVSGSRCMHVRMQRLLLLVVGCMVRACGAMLLMHRNGNRNWGVHCRGTPSCRLRIRGTRHRIELHGTRSGGGGGSRDIGSR
jgi:hypothetical protein